MTKYKFKTDSKDTILNALTQGFNESLALQSLIYHSENPLIDLIVNDEISIEIVLSPNLQIRNES